MPSNPPQDPGKRRPAVPPPPAKKPRAVDAREVIVKEPGAAERVEGNVSIPSAAPVHRQFLDRTSTTTVITLGYRPTRALVRRVYYVALGLAAVAIVAAAPALSFLPFTTAPTWARLVLLTSAIQLAYVAWMCLVPDWSTARVAMLVYAAVAAAYGFAMAVVIATPHGAPIMFEMDPVRSVAIRWCAVVMSLLAIATFFSGRLAFRWRKGYLAANRD